MISMSTGLGFWNKKFDPTESANVLYQSSELRDFNEGVYMPDTLSLTEAAQYLNTDSAILWRAAEEGALKAERIKLDEREVWRFQKEVLDAWGGAPSQAVPSEVHLAALEIVQKNQETIERLQRQMVELQLAAAQGQRLLVERNESAFQDKARLHTLSHQLTETQTELKVWKERATQPWWRKIWRKKHSPAAKTS